MADGSKNLIYSGSRVLLKHCLPREMSLAKSFVTLMNAFSNKYVRLPRNKFPNKDSRKIEKVEDAARARALDERQFPIYASKL